jgi:CxxC motif-containing protein
MSEHKEGDYQSRIDICLRCPQGCEVQTVVGPNDEILNIKGNKCKLGREYVEQEIRDPRRVLPTSVKVNNGTRPLVSAWTPEPMPKGMLLDLASDTRKIAVEAPVHVGDVIIEDWRGTGVRLVASAEVARAE